MSFANLDDVVAEVAPLARRFADAGHRLFLVGGIVRDQWLDLALDAASDIDLTTDALPDAIKRIVAPVADDLWTQGEKFGTIGLRMAGRAFEITTHRAESYSADSRKPEVSFGDRIDVDLSRRDFTVNAMAVEVPDGELIDPFDGVTDLVERRLRTPLEPDVSFSDDPLRMLRAARFLTKYALEPDAELAASAAALHDRLRIVAIERIGVELKRLLELPGAEVGLAFLGATGLLTEVLTYADPGLAPGVTPHIERAIAAAVATPLDWCQRLASIGLVAFGDVDGLQRMCRRLRLARDDERRTVGIGAAAVALLAAPDTRPATLRRWYGVSDDPHAALAVAGAVGDDPARVSAFESELNHLATLESLDDVPFLDGRAIMHELDLGPGPEIGQAQAALRRAYYEHGPLPEDNQRTILRTWWLERSS